MLFVFLRQASDRLDLLRRTQILAHFGNERSVLGSYRPSPSLSTSGRQPPKLTHSSHRAGAPHRCGQLTIDRVNVRVRRSNLRAKPARRERGSFTPETVSVLVCAKAQETLHVWAHLATPTAGESLHWNCIRDEASYGRVHAAALNDNVA